MRNKWKCKFQMTIWKLKKKKTTNEHQPSILPPNNLHFEWGNGLPLYCTTTLLLSKYFGDLHSVGKI